MDIKLPEFFRTPAEKHLLRCGMEYPTLFPNRTRVLEHWFLVNGNGYEWEHGVLVGSGGSASVCLKEEEAASNMLRDGFTGIYSFTDSPRYALIYGAVTAREDYAALAKKFCRTLLSWSPEDWAGAARIQGYRPPDVDRGMADLAQWQGAFKKLFPDLV